MQLKTLEALYKEHTGKASDKWSSYLKIYDELFSKFRDKKINLFEIGIQNGGSLEIWAKYFANANYLLGCDIDKDCGCLTFNDPRICVITGDANSNAVCESVYKQTPILDIIIDDGSHLSSDIIKSFTLYFPHLSEGGLFIVEDLHCSYWQQYEGGLFNPFSAISFFKRLSDIINYEYWGISKERNDILRGFVSRYGCAIDVESLSQIRSIEFFNSICIVHKTNSVTNNIGHQIIAGRSESITSDRIKLNGSPYIVQSTPEQSNNPWSNLVNPPDEEFLNLQDERNSEIAKFKLQILDLEQLAHSSEKAVKDIKSSFSYRTGLFVTFPIRLVYRMVIKKLFLFVISLQATLREIHNINLTVVLLLRRKGGLLVLLKIILKPKNWSQFIHRLVLLCSTYYENNKSVDAYMRYIQMNEPAIADLKQMEASLQNFTFYPKFSIVLPIFNVPEVWLRKCINSVRAQIYQNWELCIADDCSTKPYIRDCLKEYASIDSRIKVIFREVNGHISEATNSALEIANGDFLCLMDHDDEIAPNALYEFAHFLQQDSNIDMIYSDEDKMDLDGNRYEPFFKPDWSPETLEGCMYTAHFACYRMKIVNKIGGFRIGYEGAQDYDFVLRFTEYAKKIVHIPKVLYHWRAIPGSTASTMAAKDYVLAAALRALCDRANRINGGGVVKLGDYSGSFDLRYTIRNSPLISVIIPTAGSTAEIHGQQTDLLVNVVETIYKKNTYRNFEIIIVDNNNLTAKTVTALLDYPCRIVHFNERFNIAKKMNLGAKEAKGEILLFLNDDIAAITDDWMECMLQLAQRPNVGVVGAKLFFENGRLQHVGVAFCDGLPDHICRGYQGTDPGYFFSSCSNRNYLAVTGAVLMTKKSVFDKVNGFEEDFAINYNDIDYCLKVFETGNRIVFAAGAKLYHYESTSRERSVSENEIKLFQKKWGHLTLRDPYFGACFENKPPQFILKNNCDKIQLSDLAESLMCSHNVSQLLEGK